MVNNFFHEAFIIAALLLITVGVNLSYRNALDGPFVMDDFPNIIENPQVRITTLSPTGILSAAQPPKNLNKRRPLSYITFAVSHYFSGFSARSFRLFNITLLVLTGMVLIAFAFFFLKEWLDQSDALLVAAIAAIIWTLHPIQTNITTYIVQRMTLLAIFNYLATFSFFLMAREKGKAYWLPAVFFFILALASKEIAYVFPAAIIMYIYASDDSYKKILSQKPWLIYVLGGTIVLVTIALMVYFSNAYANRDFTMVQRLLTQPRVIFLYLSLYCLPFSDRFNLIHDIQLSGTIFSPPTTFLAILFHAGCLTLAVKLWHKDRIIALLIILFYLHHLMESTFLPLEMIFEHRMSLPSVFLSMLLAIILVRTTRRIFQKDLYFQGTIFFIGLFFSLFLGSMTYARNQVWTTGVNLWQDVADKSPNHIRGHLNLGTEYLNMHNYGTAEKLFERVLQLDSANTEAIVNLGTLYAQNGQPYKGIEYFKKALILESNNSKIHYNLGVTYHEIGMPEEALLHYTQSLKMNTLQRSARYNMALIYAQSGQLVHAKKFAAEELHYYPDHQKARNLLKSLEGGAMSTH